MKRKLTSLITVFALCLSLCPTWALAADTPALPSSAAVDKIEALKENRTVSAEFIVEEAQIFDICNWSYTATRTTAIVIQGTGKLYLQGLEGGSVTSSKAIGVKVESDGSLIVEDPVAVTGRTYGLDAASGAKVKLSGGTFSGDTAAIRTADGDFAALLVDGYSYFDADGNPMLPTDVATAKTVTIKQCADHPGKTYTHNSGTPTHSWACPYCKEKADAEPCTFSFDADGTAACAGCGRMITIAIDTENLGDLIYNSQEQTANVTLTVTLDGDTPLTENTDYEVSHTSRADVGEITVTVTGITYNGTFTKTYSVSQAQPVIAWAETTKAVNYSGSPIKPTDLPTINITNNYENLSEYIQYSYKKDGDTDFTDGLPTNAGTYEIKASLLESQNYKAAETNPCLTLTINKIPALTTPPAKINLTYNRAPQELVTAGVLKPGAVAEGAVIEFARTQNGSYSTEIPAETSAGNHTVWYRVRVEETGNYTGTSATQVSGVRIELKTITPTVELSYDTTLYDGGEKRPTVTVKDGEDIIPNSEYTVAYSGNRDVGKATVTVTNKANGNYKITTATANFQITIKTQDALSISGKPNTFTYGDQFTLSTTGGSGNGAVTWKITAGDSVAAVGPNSGQVTINGFGLVTIQATKSGTDPQTNKKNYEDAIATWTFTAVQKPVVATVTADNKTYDGNTTATVHAVVEQGALPGDVITINGLSGTFSDKNVGTNKTVTVKGTPSISGNRSGNYAVTLSSRSVTADITKAAASIKTAPGQRTPALTYIKETAQPLVTAGAANIAGISLEYALSENGPYSTDIPTGTGAGPYTVWYRISDSVNYTGVAPASIAVTIAKAPTTIDEDPTISGTLTDGDPLSELTLTGGKGSVEGSFDWTDGTIKPPVGTSEQEITFTPADEVNYEKATVSVTVTVTEAPSGGEGDGETPGEGDGDGDTGGTGTGTGTGSNPFVTTTFPPASPNGATTTKTEDKDTGTVTETTKKPDGSSVTKVEQKDGTTATVTTDAGGRTEAEVTLSTRAVSEAREKGGAVALPIPEVKATRSADTATAVTVNTGSGDEVMVEIPAVDVTPGTVAVLMKEEGTQEVIKTSVPTGNGVAVSLPDGATVKLVDNSKDFADVPAESWEADAVAFASARELLKGTGEATFDPDAPMTRAMMMTVLARLDGEDTTGGATWYEKGQEWAVANGISSGSDPNGDITREQLAVMLWRYAGCPAADSEALNFTDADKASDYAMEALRWAAAKGILEGTGDGMLHPDGTATRAETAQILKNFIECI